VSIRLLAAALAVALLGPLSASAAPCPGHDDALGTARVLHVDPALHPRVGRKHFPATLPLRPKEVVLTFDDGPSGALTPRVLEALRRECVRATFFLIGRNAAAHPALVRRIAAEGHTVAHHTLSHRLLDRIPPTAAEAEIEAGIAAVERALHGEPRRVPSTPFFRFPGFAANAALLERLEKRGIAVFGADLWASDWNVMAPQQQLRLVLDRLTATGGGILLLHDTVPQTAAMLPALLRALKQRGFAVVHVAAGPQVATR
jgi:peptidoglycan/xylan/chitin deacetylase (PgdA/CDA1 family)